MRTADPLAIGRLAGQVKKSKRTGSVQFPHGFAVDSAEAPPLARMLRESPVTLRMYLILVMAATTPPHHTKIPPSDLAGMLGLPDPPVAGKRRVSDALRRLERNGFVSRTLIPGRTADTQVLSPAGTGKAWSSKTLDRPYITVPINFWAKGWLLALSEPAVAVLVVLCELTQGRKGAFADRLRKQTYGLSDDTWTRGTKELVDHHLVEVKVNTYTSYGEPRRRNFYTLDRSALNDAPKLPVT